MLYNWEHSVLQTRFIVFMRIAIYFSYNTDKKSEKVNNHLNKLRDRFVKDDTTSSYTSSQVLFPKPNKQRQSVPDNVELRRSPRKRAPRSMFDENLPASQKLGNHAK